VQEIADSSKKTYLRRDFSGFKGDRKFIRDDQAQKAFSKLAARSAAFTTGASPTPNPAAPNSSA